MPSPPGPSARSARGGKGGARTRVPLGSSRRYDECPTARLAIELSAAATHAGTGRRAQGRRRPDPRLPGSARKRAHALGIRELRRARPPCSRGRPPITAWVRAAFGSCRNCPNQTFYRKAYPLRLKHQRSSLERNPSCPRGSPSSYRGSSTAASAGLRVVSPVPRPGYAGTSCARR